MFIILLLILFYIIECYVPSNNTYGGVVYTPHNKFKKPKLEHFPDEEIITLQDTDNTEINKSYDIVRSWFPDGPDKTKLQIVKETVFSLSKPDANKTLKGYIMKKFHNTKKLIITDATANVGGNSIYFSEYFKSVNSVEIDKNAHDALNNNLTMYKIKNFKTYRDDYLKIQNKLKQDIVFFDPPWGGPSMERKDKIDLKLGEFSMHNIIKNYETLPKGIVIKAPNNYYYEHLLLNKNYETFVYPYFTLLFIIMVKV